MNGTPVSQVAIGNEITQGFLWQAGQLVTGPSMPSSPSGWGLGVFYWDGDSYSYQGMFAYQGIAKPVIDAYQIGTTRTAAPWPGAGGRWGRWGYGALWRPVCGRYPFLVAGPLFRFVRNGDATPPARS